MRQNILKFHNVKKKLYIWFVDRKEFTRQSTELSRDNKHLWNGTLGFYDFKENTIVVFRDASIIRQFITLIHELCHYYMFKFSDHHKAFRGSFAFDVWWAKYIQGKILSKIIRR